MKNFLLPFSLSSLCLMMAACGGGSNQINENPTVKSEDSATGCIVSSTSSTCLEFVMEYPIAGIQYTCSSDNINTFKTQTSDNIVTGGCDKGDTVTFFLNANDNARVSLGSVELSKLGVVSADGLPLHLTLLDMAEGLTGSAPASLDASDATVQVALSLVKIFQAIGSQKSGSNVVGDLQPIELDSTSLAGLSDITASVDVTALQNGQYASILQPWIDVSQVSDDDAMQVLKQAINISLGAIYQADLPLTFTGSNGLTGTAGSSTNQTLLGTFLLISDRQGYTHGYGLQWRGVPVSSATTVAARALTLVTKSDPMMMRAAAQENWISPITDRVASVNPFQFTTTSSENLFINQGRLLNDYIAVSGEALYKATTQEDTVVAEDLTEWSMAASSGLTYTGGVDFVKGSPISYLDRNVFKTMNNVASGEEYHFPMYVNFIFRTTNGDTSLPTIKLGAVIDEYGDIRTDMKASTTSTDMTGECATIDDNTQANPLDSNGITQYRIGTLSATNNQKNQKDLSVGVRVILSGAQFGNLDGTAFGLATTAMSESGQLVSSGSGVKINLYNLLEDKGQGSLVITDYNDKTAEWTNVYNVYKSLYMNKNSTLTFTDAEKDQKKRLAGTVGIELASCYAGAKTKP